jgi:hypothetical protein
MLTEFPALIRWFVGLKLQQHVFKRMVNSCPGLSIANWPYANVYIGKSDPDSPYPTG